MPRPLPAPELVAKALAARATGRPLRDVARECGVTRTTIQRWERDAKGATPAAAPPPQQGLTAALAARAPRPAPSPPPPPESAAAAELDTLAVTRQMLADFLKRAKAAEETGNYGAAQRAGRDAGAMVNIIARLEKSEAGDADVLRISRAEIDEAMAGVRARMAVTVSRPLCCSVCSRALSVSWGTEGKAET